MSGLVDSPAVGIATINQAAAFIAIAGRDTGGGHCGCQLLIPVPESRAMSLLRFSNASIAPNPLGGPPEPGLASVSSP